MKNRFYSFTLAAVLAVALVALPLVAYAADSRSTEVLFTLTEDDLKPPVTPTPGGSGGSDGSSDDEGVTETYLIWIPSNIGLNYEQDFFINSGQVDIAANARVVVSIDGTQTFPDGTFYLTCGDGATAAQRIACNILRGSAADVSAPPSDVLTGPNDTIVASFLNGGARDTYGWIKLVPMYTLSNTAGTYSGILHFKVQVVYN